MASGGTRDVTVGALFALALLILAVGVMAVGGESRLFSKKVNYTVVFPSVDGLSVGSPVKMSGVQVGTVSAVRLSTDASIGGIEVEIGVDEAYRERVREDSRATLRILQLLTGEKFVEVTGGSVTVAFLPEGAVIEPLEDPEIFEQAAVATQNISDITVSLKKLLGALESGEGLIGQMINDPEFGQAGLAALRGSFENLQLLTGDILEGRGFVGRLLYDESFSVKIDELASAIGSFSALLASVDFEKGALGALLTEDGPGEQAIRDLGEAAASLKVVAARLENGEGLLGKLLQETSYDGDMAADLGLTMTNLAEITEKINRGEGTLGALVNNPVLYDGAEEVLAGVNDSKFARWLLRHYQKQGIEAEEKAERDGEED